MTGIPALQVAAFRCDAGLSLLDRQIVDKDGLMAGKVDDLELTEIEGIAGPIVTAILTGPQVLAAHLGGRLGRFVAAAARRVHFKEPSGPGRISFGVVKKIDNHVEITVSADDLDGAAAGLAIRRTIIARIPGSEHEPE